MHDCDIWITLYYATLCVYQVWQLGTYASYAKLRPMYQSPG